MSNQPSEELKPCPFCKSKAIIGKFSDDYQTTGWAECTKSGCSASIEVDGGEQKAIAAWNTRKGEDERIAQAVAAERARCLEILCYPRKHFSAAYPDWMVWLIELDIRNGVEQPKRGE